MFLLKANMQKTNALESSKQVHTPDLLTASAIFWAAHLPGRLSPPPEPVKDSQCFIVSLPEFSESVIRNICLFLKS